MDSVELRNCSIDLLLSMLSLPLHFLDQPLPGESVWVGGVACDKYLCLGCLYTAIGVLHGA